MASKQLRGRAAGQVRDSVIDSSKLSVRHTEVECTTLVGASFPASSIQCDSWEEPMNFTVQVAAVAKKAFAQLQLVHPYLNQSGLNHTWLQWSMHWWHQASIIVTYSVWSYPWSLTGNIGFQWTQPLMWSWGCTKCCESTVFSHCFQSHWLLIHFQAQFKNSSGPFKHFMI